jgi:hypothetical protein
VYEYVVKYRNKVVFSETFSSESAARSFFSRHAKGFSRRDDIRIILRDRKGNVLGDTWARKRVVDPRHPNVEMMP